jgi:hypothetical protein
LGLGFGFGLWVSFFFFSVFVYFLFTFCSFSLFMGQTGSLHLAFTLGLGVQLQFGRTRLQDRLRALCIFMDRIELGQVGFGYTYRLLSFGSLGSWTCVG